ncbi:PREDICTED: ankyrin-3-like [Amphimedon queenslandica]|uniref:Uncharacterized protein n=1 Tax=Amphimedon queenslandica TaxID=400682 RepID=A0A1X7U3X6_AMPQE|nr:PREDICTED: ankyrin-3-like [Amphimedon queenslandica]|eukprot:XP_011406146.2 PREDICTED: ankyrin-3-like [Amphimedon queenslandica]
MADQTEILVELLSTASKGVDTSQVTQLLENGADPLIGQPLCPLQIAIKRSMATLIKILLPFCSPQALSDRAPSLLLYAINHNNSIDTIQLLLDSINGVDSLNTLTNGTTPLISALLKGRLPIASYLLDKGADPNFSDANGTFPVHVAVKHGNMDLLEELSSFGASFDVQDGLGYTPLHYVTHCTIAEYLTLHKGVDPFIKNNRGETALVLARRRGDESLSSSLADIESNWNLLSHASRSKRHWLLWYLSDTFKRLGFKISLIVIIICIIMAWTLSVYIHGGRHPFQ